MHPDRLAQLIAENDADLALARRQGDDEWVRSLVYRRVSLAELGRRTHGFQPREQPATADREEAA